MSPPRFGVLGDDLSGVNAVLAEAAGLGLRCCVTGATGARPPREVDVWGIDLASRDGGAEGGTASAREQIARLRAWGAVHLLVKIDSLWRGDPMALIMAAAAEVRPVVVSAAAPASLTGAALVAQANPFLATAEILAHHRRGQRLWVGGVGILTVLLWAGLAGRAPLAAVVGSFQPNVAAQMVALQGMGAAILPFATPDLKARLADAWATGQPVVIETIPKDGAMAGVAAGETAFREAASLLEPHLADRVFGLILTGGHTGKAVLAGLGVERLDLLGPSVVEGAPLLRAAIPSLSKGLIATKPGHFGGPDALVRMAMQLQLRAAAIGA